LCSYSFSELSFSEIFKLLKSHKLKQENLQAESFHNTLTVSHLHNSQHKADQCLQVFICEHCTQQSQNSIITIFFLKLFYHSISTSLDFTEQQILFKLYFNFDQLIFLSHLIYQVAVWKICECFNLTSSSS